MAGRDRTSAFLSLGDRHGVWIRSPSFFIARRSMRSVDAIAPYFFIDKRSMRSVDAIAACLQVRAV
ncbi:hypothetical protein [Argonema galeatum]|uniref:hypothetical protein n=1 Tax=Argonema galeatum TaxID=2942762 RepID=UPI0020124BEC|nr:hypothetical protein [Argonema galeatum]MCL1466493.1 hypothetical protein [Argonema galeatum A003/A1]